MKLNFGVKKAQTANRRAAKVAAAAAEVTAATDTLAGKPIY